MTSKTPFADIKSKFVEPEELEDELQLLSHTPPCQLQAPLVPQVALEYVPSQHLTASTLCTHMKIRQTNRNHRLNDVKCFRFLLRHINHLLHGIPALVAVGLVVVDYGCWVVVSGVVGCIVCSNGDLIGTCWQGWNSVAG